MAAKDFSKHGSPVYLCDRIMTAPDFAESPLTMIAREKIFAGYKLAFIFERADGWTLGTDLFNLFWAFRTWAREWTHVWIIRRGCAPERVTLARWLGLFKEGQLMD